MKNRKKTESALTPQLYRRKRYLFNTSRTQFSSFGLLPDFTLLAVFTFNVVNHQFSALFL
ncbi:hypothetical protein C7N43_01735 [Sphingobacteriales bacterium UPWRP_1]|nr:hypothetical protein B6N25_15080 [Sphingobacteriales bacterium TSM_CSS]PSJ78747.1 hypothetical protein C7N43_01735 [Sphingobacteriales bacterium UPWRP_1]